MARIAASKLAGIVLVVLGVAAGAVFGWLLRNDEASRPAAAAAQMPAQAASPAFEATVANTAGPPGPAPDGMAWIPGGEFSTRSPYPDARALLDAGKEEPVALALERMLAMRAYMRAKTVDGMIDERIAERVGLSALAIEDMYHVMAIANYEDRFVIPTAHRELDEDAYDLRGSCGFSFGNGCSGGSSEVNLFGAPKRARTPMEVA